MKPGQVVKLTNDITSVKKNAKGQHLTYGRAGENVSIVSIRGEVLIVENNLKERFPVHINNTTPLPC